MPRFLFILVEAPMQISSIEMFLTFVMFRSDTIPTALLIFGSCYFAKPSHCTVFNLRVRNWLNSCLILMPSFDWILFKRISFFIWQNNLVGISPKGTGSPATRQPPLATRHSPLATRHPPLATRHPLLATRHPPLATCFWGRELPKIFRKKIEKIT